MATYTKRKAKAMDEDTLFRRIDLRKVTEQIREQYPETPNANMLARQMVVAFNKSVGAMVDEFERGEGLFSSCYFDAKDKHAL